MTTLITALILYRNNFLILRRATGDFKDKWEIPNVPLTESETIKDDLRDAITNTIGLSIFPYLKIDSFNAAYPDAPVVIYKCSLISRPPELSTNSNYSGFLWTHICNVADLPFAPPHDDIIAFLQNDPSVIRKKSRAPYTKSQLPGVARRGFASMTLEKRRRIAGLGGKAAHASGMAHTWTSEEAALAGKIGGSKRWK